MAWKDAYEGIRFPDRIDMKPSYGISMCDGKYVTTGTVGEGPLSHKVSAIDTVGGEEVEIKMHRPDFFIDMESYGDMLADAQKAVELNHPAIITVMDSFMDGTTPCTVEARAKGESLGDFMVKKRTVLRVSGADCSIETPLPEIQAVSIAMQAASVLAKAHAAGFVHGNLKPCNIILLGGHDKGRAMISDFGCWRLRREIPSDMLENTSDIEDDEDYLRLEMWQYRYRSRAFYDAPEVAAGCEPTPASDVWSLGIILYEMLCGFVPQEAPDEGISLKGIEPPHMAAKARRVSQKLSLITMGCLAEDPARRYADASVLYRVLADYAASEEMPIDPATGALDLIGLKQKAASESAETARERMKRQDGGTDRTERMPHAVVQDKVAKAVKAGPANRNRDDREARHGRPKHKRVARAVISAVIAIATLAALVAGAAAAMAAIGIGPSSMGKVPNVMGVHRDQAMTALERDGFSVGEVSEVYDEEVPKDVVISQDPAGGSKAPSGSAVSLTVSKGREPSGVGIVPAVDGMLASEAYAKLDGEGFTMVFGDIVEDNAAAAEGREGTIAEQDPPAGTSAERGTAITVRPVFASGVGRLPAVAGMKRDEAVAAMLDAGYMPRIVERYDEKVPAGTVISTERDPAEDVPRGLTVTMWISKGKNATGKLAGAPAEDSGTAAGAKDNGTASKTDASGGSSGSSKETAKDDGKQEAGQQDHGGAQTQSQPQAPSSSETAGTDAAGGGGNGSGSGSGEAADPVPWSPEQEAPHDSQVDPGSADGGTAPDGGGHDGGSAPDAGSGDGGGYDGGGTMPEEPPADASSASNGGDGGSDFL